MTAPAGLFAADGRRRTQFAELDHPFELPDVLSAADRALLAGLRTRKALLSSTSWPRLASPIETMTFAMEHGVAGAATQARRRFLRVASWNIQRGIETDGIAAFLKETPGLRDADVVMLNEVDLGMARSQNRNVARDLAQSLGFHYVFGNSYVCLDHGDVRDGVHDEDNAVGLHGNAILSRFPFRRAENCSIHITKDKFQSRSEKRLGHKKALWAELEAPFGVFPVVCTHLDPIASPAQRRAQLSDLADILDERGLETLLLGGDLNTITYDLSSLPKLAKNLAAKLARGGFPHGIHHYMHPWELYEKPVFDELAARGFEHLTFNDMSSGTTRYEVGSFDSESKIRDYFPEAAVKLLRWKLKPWGGVAPIHIDWFAGRGAVRALAAGEVVEEDGRASLGPTVYARPKWDGKLLSDHDPLSVDVVV